MEGEQRKAPLAARKAACAASLLSAVLMLFMATNPWLIHQDSRVDTRTDVGLPVCSAVSIPDEINKAAHSEGDGEGWIVRHVGVFLTWTHFWVWGVNAGRYNAEFGYIDMAGDAVEYSEYESSASFWDDFAPDQDGCMKRLFIGLEIAFAFAALSVFTSAIMHFTRLRREVCVGRGSWIVDLVAFVILIICDSIAVIVLAAPVCKWRTYYFQLQAYEDHIASLRALPYTCGWDEASFAPSFSMFGIGICALLHVGLMISSCCAK